MEAAMIMMMTLPALITSVAIAANAKKINAQWRRKRDERLTRESALS